MFLQSSHNHRCKTTCTGPTNYSAINCELPLKAGEVYSKHINTLLQLYFPELKKQNVRCIMGSTFHHQQQNHKYEISNATIVTLSVLNFINNSIKFNGIKDITQKTLHENNVDSHRIW
jgi:1-deoxy-D-xylulose 5-phosphate reductoisomerase